LLKPPIVTVRSRRPSMRAGDVTAAVVGEGTRETSSVRTTASVFFSVLARSSRSRSVQTLPVGLVGVLTTTARVFRVISCAGTARSLELAPVVAVERLEEDDLVAGVEEGRPAAKRRRRSRS
jgi:hypothetical protein